MKSQSEPSGVRLLRLINTRILEITNKELSNSDRICLYGTGGWWTAFDRSAYALSRLFPAAESLVVTPPGAPFSVVGLTITENDLKKYLMTHEPLCRKTDYLELPASVFNFQDYDIWHKRIVNEFDKIISNPKHYGYNMVN